MRKAIVSVLVTAIVGGSVVGCESKAGTGAIAGGAGGALVGGIIGNNSHGRTAEGALIGGAVGAIGGALIGHGLDKSDEKKEKERQRQEAERERQYYSGGPTYSGQPMVARPAQMVTANDVVEWTRKGVKEEVIVDRIERSGQSFYLTAAEENMMRDARVSDRVIVAMKNNRRQY